jgi:hypothetical protein
MINIAAGAISRKRLLNRRCSITTDLVLRSARYAVTFSFENGSVAEVFIDPAKPGSHIAEDARDCGILVSTPCSLERH